jgi:hypothetical protein
MLYSVSQNYAKLLLTLAELDIDKRHYNKYRENMNKSFKHFR